MRDQKRCQKMDSHRSGTRRKYDKEMNNAFTLIFHNIKRLQDGHLSSGTHNGDTASTQAEMNPPTTLQVPRQRPRASSDPLSGLAEGRMFRQTNEVSDTRPKSQSVTDEASLLSQRRKVTFADHHTEKQQPQRASDLIKRRSSDLQPRIVFNER